MMKLLILTLLIVLIITNVFAQETNEDTLTTTYLKKLTLEELMNINVTIVTKQKQQWFEAPASVYVISEKEIINSGSRNIPEVLRLAPNLNAAQVNSSQWAISARGFNNVLANKLLVMIDGRPVYTPLYSGVFWDVQNVFLKDIKHIEVISGPGGTTWGANAVNGVINIITKSSKDTEGLLIEGASGNELNYSSALRYGADLNEKLSFRIYGKIFRIGNTLLQNKTDANDDWTNNQGGFRADWVITENNNLTLQGDYYNGKVNPDGVSPVLNEGGNVLTRWNSSLSESSSIDLLLFYDQTWRDFGNGFSEKLITSNFEAQHNFLLNRRHNIVWGMGVRQRIHNVQNLPLFAFIPPEKTLYIYNIFFQDEITLIEDLISITLGSKFEYNDYTKFEIQPSGRLTFKTGSQTIWAAISRAVRTPSRLEREFMLSISPGIPFLTGNSNFISEELLAYEAGWRIQPSKNFNFSFAAFFNVYENIRSAEPGPPPLFIPVIIGNGVEGETYGIEIMTINELTDWWRINLGYVFLKKILSIKDNSNDLNKGTAESDDPEHLFKFFSTVNISSNLEFTTFLRFSDELPVSGVPGYLEMDINFEWKLNEYLALSVTGQNLLHKSHPEFIPSSPSPRLIERSFYGKVSFSL